jgi:hypothetical protein
MSQAYHCRPSSILGVTEGLPAFGIDRATWIFAKNVEAEQEKAVDRLPSNATEASKKLVREHVLDVFLGVMSRTGRYRDPATR